VKPPLIIIEEHMPTRGNPEYYWKSHY